MKVAVNGRDLEGVCHSAIIYPLRRLDGPGASGLLLIGLNPQRNFDNAYRRFLRHTIDQFVRAAAVILVPAERERWKQAHDIAKKQELAFTRLAQFAPAGLALFEPTGRLRYCNPGYEHLSNPQKDETSPYGYRIRKHPDDHLNVENMVSVDILIRDQDPSISTSCSEKQVSASRHEHARALELGLRDGDKAV